MQRITKQNLVIIIFLALWSPFTLALNRLDPADMLPTDRTLKSTLCGKLVFIDNIKTGAKLIGLIPCGESRPYIFNRRPAELHNFYRFQDVVIEKDKNMSISTANYGVIYTYIFKFRDYVPIESCNECRDFSPTATADYTKPVIDCSNWILEESAAQFSDSIDTIDLDRINAVIEDSASISQIQAECNANGTCLEQKTALKLGNELGGLFHQRGITLQKVILFLKSLLSKPDGLQVCPSIDRMAWYLAIGLNQRGYAIEILETTSPATPLVKDEQKHQTGIQEDGSTVEEIPNSGVAVTGWNIYILFPSSNPVILQIRGANFGSVVVSAIHVRHTVIQNVAFEGLLFTKSTRGSLDFIDEQPVLKIDTLNNGTVEAHNPDFYEEYPILETWQIVSIPTDTVITTASSATPTTLSVQTATASPLPSKESIHTPTINPIEKSSTPSICPNFLGLAILPIVACWQRKLFVSRRLKALEIPSASNFGI